MEKKKLEDMTLYEVFAINYDGDIGDVIADIDRRLKALEKK